MIITVIGKAVTLNLLLIKARERLELTSFTYEIDKYKYILIAFRSSHVGILLMTIGPIYL